MNKYKDYGSKSGAVCECGCASYGFAEEGGAVSEEHSELGYFAILS